MASSARMDVDASASAAGASAASSSSSSASLPLAPSSRYTYAVTAQPPTLVTHTLVCSFTAPHERNLILVRSTRLEVYRMSADGLESVLDVPVYGRVTAIVALRAPGGGGSGDNRTERVFVATERHKFFVMRYDADTKELVTMATGDSKLKIGRMSDQGCLALLDPSNSWLALHQYCGIVQMLGVDPQSGALARELLECKLDTLQVLQMVWLQGQSKPTLLVLSKESDDKGDFTALRSFTFEAREKELKPAPSAVNAARCEAGAAQIIPTQFGGALVVAEQMITYLPVGSKSSVQLPVPPFVCCAWCPVDRSRFLLGDLEGGLHALLVQSAGEVVTGLRLEYLGVTSIAHRLQYIDNSFVMVGSHYGDSQLIKLHREPQPVSGEEEEDAADQAAQDAEGGAAAMDVDGAEAPSSAAVASGPRPPVAKRPNFITIESTFEHLGPIVDFDMLDLERNGQGAMLACCGAYKDGSVRIVRNGIGVREEAAIELPGIQGVWSLADPAAPASATGSDEAHKMLVQAFATETRVLALEPDEEGGDALQLAECEIAGFDAAQRTLFCSNMSGGLLLQVTQHSARLVDGRTLQLVDEWKPASGKITVASANSSQLLLAAGKVLSLITLQGRKLQTQTQTTLDEEISCLDISPLNGAASASFAAVCMWRENSVRVLRTSNLEEVSRERLGDTVARSVLLAQFEAGTAEAASYLMCGLGDGNLLSFEMNPTTAAINSKKKLTVGTSGIELRSFWSQSHLHVFASCDRPTVISCANGKLLYSNVNVSSVAHMSPFHAPGVFQHCVAMASADGLRIGHVDDIQRLHIQRVATEGQPRRLAHHAASKSVLVGVVERSVEWTADDLLGEMHKLKLYDDDAFQLHDTMSLQTNETVLTIASMQLNTHDGDSHADAAAAAAASAAWPHYLVVGTAYLNPDEPEPSAGRLLVLAVDTSNGRRTLRLVSSAAVKGGVQKVASLQGRIVAGVNARVVVYRCVTAPHGASGSGGEFRLEKRCDYAGNVLVLHLSVSRDGQYILVGDLMKGVCVLHYQQHSLANALQTSAGDCSLSEVSRHYESLWLTALESFSAADDVCVVADHHHNLLTVRRQIDGATDDDRARMECVGRWHCGELINKIARGTLIMPLPHEADGGGGAAMAADSSASATSASAAAASSSSAAGMFERVVPTHLYATLEGGIGVLAPVAAATYKFFARLEEELEKSLRAVGNLSHREWRAFHSERRVEESTGVIDGDLVEKFLLLSPSAQEAIARKLDVRLADCIKRVEDVQRIH